MTSRLWIVERRARPGWPWVARSVPVTRAVADRIAARGASGDAHMPYRPVYRVRPA